MLVSEHVQQLQSASSLSSPQEQKAQAGTQHQPVTSPLDQPIEGSVQYQPFGNDQTSLTTETSSQYHPLGNGTSGTTPAQYLPFGEGHTSDDIAEAQLTHHISRDDDAEIPAAHFARDIAADPARVLVALDLKATFQNASRRAMLHIIEQRDPDFAAVFSRWPLLCGR